MELAAIGIVYLLVGVGLAYYVLSNISNSKIKTAEQQLKDAQTNADRIVYSSPSRKPVKKKLPSRLKKKFFSLSRQQRQKRKRVRVSFCSMENRILQREESLDHHADALEGA